MTYQAFCLLLHKVGKLSRFFARHPTVQVGVEAETDLNFNFFYQSWRKSKESKKDKNLLLSSQVCTFKIVQASESPEEGKCLKEKRNDPPDSVRLTPR